jgi:hypothetical protein
MAVTKPYRSKLEEALKKMPQDKMSGSQLRGYLGKSEASGDELFWSKMNEFAEQDKITKQKALKHYEANKLDITEVERSQAPSNAPPHLSQVEELTNEAYSRANEAYATGRLSVDDFDGFVEDYINDNWPGSPPVFPHSRAQIDDANTRAREIVDRDVQAGRIEPDQFNMMIEDMRERILRNTEPKGIGTQYDEYQLPGGKDYQELTIGLKRPGGNFTQKELDTGYRQHPDGSVTPVPGDQSRRFTGGHWPEDDVLAHTRYNTRDIDGEKTMHLEEVQSDWLQKGRKVGFEGDVAQWSEDAGKFKYNLPGSKTGNYKLTPIPDSGGQVRMLDPAGRLYTMKSMEHAKEAVEKLADAHHVMILDAPFKKKWVDLTMRRMIREAVDSGHTRISWTMGDDQVARYPGMGQKEAEGLKKFYDENLANVAKKLGAKIEVKRLPGTGEGFSGRVAPAENGGWNAFSHDGRKSLHLPPGSVSNEAEALAYFKEEFPGAELKQVLSFEITDKMKKKALEGVGL